MVNYLHINYDDRHLSFSDVFLSQSSTEDYSFLQGDWCFPLSQDQLGDFVERNIRFGSDYKEATDSNHEKYQTFLKLLNDKRFEEAVAYFNKHI